MNSLFYKKNDLRFCLLSEKYDKKTIYRNKFNVLYFISKVKRLKKNAIYNLFLEKPVALISNYLIGKEL